MSPFSPGKFWNGRFFVQVYIVFKSGETWACGGMVYRIRSISLSSTICHPNLLLSLDLSTGTRSIEHQRDKVTNITKQFKFKVKMSIVKSNQVNLFQFESNRTLRIFWLNAVIWRNFYWRRQDPPPGNRNVVVSFSGPASHFVVQVVSRGWLTLQWRNLSHCWKLEDEES